MIARVVRDARAWEASLVGALLALAALAWVATGRLAEPDMRFGLLTGAGSMSSMDAMSPALGMFIATWIVMMIAMMFPAVAPVVVTVHRWIIRTGRPRSATALFVAGYLLVWAGFGGVVYALIVYAVSVMPGGEAAVRIGAAVLLLAGVYQFTPLKNVCLRHCRSPLAFIAEHTTQLQRGGLTGAKVGVLHGAFCLGCCWMLMLVLVVMGMMSLAWMAGIAGVIFAEKVLPRRWALSRPVGFVLVGAGIALMLSPQALPAFA
jgi:predicted metal-binding membrane protein